MAISGRGSFPLISTLFRKRRKGSLVPLIPSGAFGDPSKTESIIFNDWFFASGGVVYTLTAQAGSYSIAGQGANLYRNRNLVAQSGSYGISGQTATLLRSKLLVAQVGSYTITGIDAVLTHNAASTVYTLTALPGSYTLSGQSATLLKSKLLTVQTGAYNIVGQDVGISRSRLLTAQSGSYVVTGISAVLTHTGTGSPVWPLPNQVLLGITYGPTGADYTGTLVTLTTGVKLDINTGALVLPINDKVVMTL